ncbi:metallophosphoesterase family protein [Paraburkholderia phosphatilytica]|uniref:metallophosphoesterase family protein n=1 Tax=Paraburkholderia phosphatilytica TaxID=2282883 RepID=UPI000E477377|nr:metallophosphoesterase family protein [Paraburkholderia phosphatilytica]
MHRQPELPSASRIGLISDTHDLVRPEALAWLEGCDALIHAGDICKASVLDELSSVTPGTPLTVVRGNNDVGDWADALPHYTTLRVQQVTILVIHDLHDLRRLDLDLRAEGIGVVVSGHSHKPSVETRDGVLYVNPGSAGRRRFTLPISAGKLEIDGADVRASLKTLVE